MTREATLTLAAVALVLGAAIASAVAAIPGDQNVLAFLAGNLIGGAAFLALYSLTLPDRGHTS